MQAQLSTLLRRMEKIPYEEEDLTRNARIEGEAEIEGSSGPQSRKRLVVVTHLQGVTLS